MSNNEKYTIKELSFDEMLNDLSNTSPLMMSKKLIEYELYDQQDSLDVLNRIYKEFDDKGVVNSLVTPLLLNIIDGLMKHPKLSFSKNKKKNEKNELDKMGITASKLYYEVHNFTYEGWIIQKIYQDDNLNQAQKFHYSSWLRKNFYDLEQGNRKRTEKEKGIKRDENGSGQVKDDVTGNTLEMKIADANGDTSKIANMDHVNPINYLRKFYKNNPYIYRDDIEKLVSMTENESYINQKLNGGSYHGKGEMTWSKYIETSPKDDDGNILDKNGNIELTPEQQNKALKLEQEANNAQQQEVTKIMAKNIGLLALGDAIIMILKPIWFELKEIFTKGVLYGFEDKTKDKLEAIKLRFKRVKEYIKDNIMPMISNRIKETLENFVGILISLSVDLFKGLLQKTVQIISDGFLAIKEAFKVMLKDKDQFGNKITLVQKADAITKIIVTAIVPIVMFSFEESLSKIPIIGDVATIIISGLATTLIVWFLDQIDLFSVKGEKRLARVKEIFELRIETIKQNTDIFEKTSIEILAKQKLQFKNIMANMNIAIDNNQNINQSVYELADFMKIDLKVKSTDEFLSLLSNSKELDIEKAIKQLP